MRQWRTLERIVCLKVGDHYDWSIDAARGNSVGLRVVVGAGRPCRLDGERPSHTYPTLAYFFTPVSRVFFTTP